MTENIIKRRRKKLKKRKKKVESRRSTQITTRTDIVIISFQNSNFRLIRIKKGNIHRSRKSRIRGGRGEDVKKGLSGSFCLLFIKEIVFSFIVIQLEKE